MKPERIGLEARIDDLREQQGWTADDTPQAIVKTYDFANYSEAMGFLIEVGALTEEFETVPAIFVENGTKVTLQLGHEPNPGVSEADVAFAEALSNP